MNGLSCGEESMTTYSAVLIGCQRVTDGRTDGRTDRQTDGRTDVKPIAITCFSIADARKNEMMIGPNCLPTSSSISVLFTVIRR